jgi:hypothetical protein
VETDTDISVPLRDMVSTMGSGWSAENIVPLAAAA